MRILLHESVSVLFLLAPYKQLRPHTAQPFLWLVWGLGPILSEPAAAGTDWRIQANARLLSLDRLGLRMSLHKRRYSCYDMEYKCMMVLIIVTTQHMRIDRCTTAFNVDICPAGVLLTHQANSHPCTHTLYTQPFFPSPFFLQPFRVIVVQRKKSRK